MADEVRVILFSPEETLEAISLLNVTASRLFFGMAVSCTLRSEPNVIAVVEVEIHDGIEPVEVNSTQIAAAMIGYCRRARRVLPALPAFGKGRTRLQPVFVEDVAAAIVHIVEDSSARGRTFELGGPKVYSYRDLTRLVLTIRNRQRPIFPYPFTLAKLQAKVAEWLPSAPLTVAQVELLEQDNVTSEVSPGFDELGMTPRSIEDVAPTYLNG